MNLVTIEEISKQYGERELLTAVHLLINAGDRIALLGRNGSGKTTLLKIVAGLETPDDGRLTIWGNVRVRYLDQHPILDEQLTVLETVFQSNVPQMRLLREYERVTLQLQRAPQDPQLQSHLLTLTEEMDRLDGWTAEANAKTILTQLGITEFETPVGILSGGQRRRVALAQALIDPGELLILDEPTNHIDANTVSWLEDFLQNMSAALLMVTHDRYFLERVANRIVELDRRQLIVYEGNYSQYLEQRADRELLLAEKEEKRQALLRRELEWLRRGAQARSTKQKARIQRVEELQTIKHDRPDNRVAIALSSRRLGKQVLEAHNLRKAYGDLVLFDNLDFHLDPGDRIGIVGPNGAGKSTFLDVLAGKTAADAGSILWGSTVELGYFDQRSEDLLRNESKRVEEYIADMAPLILTKDGERVDPFQMLEWFLFPRPEQRTRLMSLSGGERRRLYLLRTLVRQPNVLFLDEPTNDLDIQTLTVLEEFLDNFKGTLVAVSHDRYFLDRNVDFIMSFDNGVLGTRYPSPYRPEEHHTRPQPKPEKKDVKPAAAISSPPQTDQPRKLSWKEQRELEALEEELPILEAKIADLQSEINASGSDYQRMSELAAELETANANLESVMDRWLELLELVEQ